MINQFLRPLLLLCLLSFAACQPDAPDAPDTPVRFGDAQVESIYQHYLDLQRALADSDAGQATAAAGRLNDALSDSQTELRYLARHIAASTDIEVQRRYFLPMTDQLEAVFSKRLTQGTIYRMHCPTANKGIGGDWLSGGSTVQNPYLGTAMPTCGTVVSHLRGRG